MYSSETEAPKVTARGLTLVELVLVIVITGIVSTMTPTLFFHGVKAMVFLPRALAANHVAQEALQQMVEGGFSTLQAGPVRGLRFAVRWPPLGVTGSTPALWLTEANRIGFLASDGRYVLLRLDTTNNVIKRSWPPTTTTCFTVNAVLPSLTEERLPYEIGQLGAMVQIVAASGLFVYHYQDGSVAPQNCPPDALIRRVDVTFTAQTGSGNFDQGDAREEMTSTVAVRVP